MFTLDMRAERAETRRDAQTSSMDVAHPLARAGLLQPGADIIIDAKSGISGAGKAPTERTHFCENHASVAAYGVFGHRHTPEMEQALGQRVTFVPHLVPLDRGILSSIYASLVPEATAEAVTLFGPTAVIRHWHWNGREWRE